MFYTKKLFNKYSKGIKKVAITKIVDVDESKKHLKYPCAVFNSLNNYKTVMIWRAWEIILYFKGVCWHSQVLVSLSLWFRWLCNLQQGSNWEFTFSFTWACSKFWGEKKPPKVVTFLFQTTFLILEGLNIIVVAVEI